MILTIAIPVLPAFVADFRLRRRTWARSRVEEGTKAVIITRDRG
ncbi:hypothetical protein [Streptomyces sp. NPDC054863]